VTEAMTFGPLMMSTGAPSEKVKPLGMGVTSPTGTLSVPVPLALVARIRMNGSLICAEAAAPMQSVPAIATQRALNLLAIGHCLS
jgi:hypothetical protein